MKKERGKGEFCKVCRHSQKIKKKLYVVIESQFCKEESILMIQVEQREKVGNLWVQLFEKFELQSTSTS